MSNTIKQVPALRYIIQYQTANGEWRPVGTASNGNEERPTSFSRFAEAVRFVVECSEAIIEQIVSNDLDLDDGYKLSEERIFDSETENCFYFTHQDNVAKVIYPNGTSVSAEGLFPLENQPTCNLHCA